MVDVRDDREVADELRVHGANRIRSTPRFRSTNVLTSEPFRIPGCRERSALSETPRAVRGRADRVCFAGGEEDLLVLLVAQA
jgi:hypothetical protein